MIIKYSWNYYYSRLDERKIRKSEFDIEDEDYLYKDDIRFPIYSYNKYEKPFRTRIFFDSKEELLKNKRKEILKEIERISSIRDGLFKQLNLVEDILDESKT